MTLNIKTDNALLYRMKQAAGKPLNTNEVRAQRVSFIMGSMPEDAHVTKADVEKVLDQMEGTKPAA